MGKTHHSGISVGDVDGTYGGVMLCMVQAYTALATGARLVFNEQALIRDVYVINNSTGAGVAGTLKLGTTEHGTDIGSFLLSGDEPTPVCKRVTGSVWMELAAPATVPSTVFVSYVTTTV